MAALSPIEALTSPVALNQFEGRRNAVQGAGRELGLRYGEAVWIGGAGLAAQGVDTNLAGFDGDVITADERYRRLAGLWTDSHRFGLPPRGQLSVRASNGLEVTALSSPLSTNVANGFGLARFSDFQAYVEVHNGLPTLPAAMLARAKLVRGDDKDILGIIKGQVVGWATNHEITRNQSWRDCAAAAVDLARQAWPNRRPPRRHGLPEWIGSLIASDFDHPALRGLRSASSRRAA